MQNITASFLIFFICFVSFSQTDNSIKPLFPDTEIPAKSVYKTTKINLQKLQKEDSIRDARNGTFRFGYAHRVNLSPHNCGKWIQVSKGRVWRLKIKSESASSINLVFETFYLPQKASLHLYTIDRAQVIGAYTSKNNNAQEKLGTELIFDDEVIVEYFEPKEHYGEGKLSIGQIIQGYRDIPKRIKTTQINESGDCNIDSNCPLGTNWQDEKRGVARILTAGFLCSGTLINNTKNDGKPYLLTGNHCYEDSEPAISVFRFNYESILNVCAEEGTSVANSQNQTINGAIKRANATRSDFYLVELNSVPPRDYNVYYAGWDRSTIAPLEVTGIHHPSGDVKKICYDNESPKKRIRNFGTGSAQCWEVSDWTAGVTEGGSSGSALFNRAGLIVGNLYGGDASCDGITDNGGFDAYGRFDISWDVEGTTKETRLKDWLDPHNTGVMTLSGFDTKPTLNYDVEITEIQSPLNTACDGTTICPIITISNNGIKTLTSLVIDYGVDQNANQSYIWTGSLQSNASEKIFLPCFTNTIGNHTFEVKTSKPNGEEDEFQENDTLSVGFESLGQVGTITTQLNLGFDCWPQETLWQLTGPEGVIDQRNVYDSTIFAMATIQENWCLLPDKCYSYQIEDRNLDGINGSIFSNCGIDGFVEIKLEDGRNFNINPDFEDVAVIDFCLYPLSSNHRNYSDETNSYFIYPQPASKFIKIKLMKSTHIINYTIFNTVGKKTQAGSLSNNLEINVENLLPGIYLLQLNNNDQSTMKSFIKK